MKGQIKIISNKLASYIPDWDLTSVDIYKDVPPIISILEESFIELKNIVSNYKFPSSEEEICFFKETKPQLFSKLIFLRKVYQLELNKPVSNYKTIRAYLEKEHDQINLFCNKNVEFIQYYRSGQTLLDKYYFLRGWKIRRTLTPRAKAKLTPEKIL